MARTCFFGEFVFLYRPETRRRSFPPVFRGGTELQVVAREIIDL